MPQDAYLKNLEANGGNDSAAEGILLYPQVEAPVALSYRVQGHAMRVCTVNLAEPWANIERSLLGLIGLEPPATAAAYSWRDTIAGPDARRGNSSIRIVARARSSIARARPGPR
jgi:hypothetical protein